MSNMTSIMKLHGGEYLEKFAAMMPENHKKVIHAISNCRQGYYGYSDYECKCCKKSKRILNCCGNRHCPSCQTDKNQKWLAKQMEAQSACLDVASPPAACVLFHDYIHGPQRTESSDSL